MAANQILLVTCFTVASTIGACAQPDDAANWLTPEGEITSNSGASEPIPYIIVEKEARQDAIQALETAAIIPLSEDRARYYGGDALGDMESDLGRRSFELAMAHKPRLPDRTPFLVRGVNPNAGGHCNARLAGDTLYMNCESLGEWHYEKRPYVVLLERPPVHINLLAFSAK